MPPEIRLNTNIRKYALRALKLLLNYPIDFESNNNSKLELSRAQLQRLQL